MNVLKNISAKKRDTIPDKKSKSSNRVPLAINHLPSLKVAINKENIYIKNNQYLEIINQNKKKK